MDATRTWTYDGRDWPYDTETSTEIDARVAAATTEADMRLGLTELEWYEWIFSDEPTDGLD